MPTRSNCLSVLCLTAPVYVQIHGQPSPLPALFREEVNAEILSL